MDTVVACKEDGRERGVSPLLNKEIYCKKKEIKIRSWISSDLLKKLAVSKYTVL